MEFVRSVGRFLSVTRLVVRLFVSLLGLNDAAAH